MLTEGNLSFKECGEYSRWPLLLKIEIFSNGQNCSILCQSVPKFELYKYNDELFNMYYSHLEWRARLSDTILKGTHPGTIPAKFGLTWFSGFRGEDLNEIFYQNMPNLPPSTFHILIFSSETTGPIATKLWWNGPWMAPFQNCVW
jgi:hypothetical protein